MLVCKDFYLLAYIIAMQPIREDCWRPPERKPPTCSYLTTKRLKLAWSVKVLLLGSFNKDKEPSLKIVNIDVKQTMRCQNLRTLLPFWSLTAHQHCRHCTKHSHHNIGPVPVLMLSMSVYKETLYCMKSMYCLDMCTTASYCSVLQNNILCLACSLLLYNTRRKGNCEAQGKLIQKYLLAAKAMRRRSH